MKLETFFENFDRFAEAPNAVGRMRELVVELALSGLLTTQHSGDESAKILLRRVEAETKKPPPHCEIEHKRLPQNWVWTNAIYPAEQISDRGKKIKTKDVLEAGDFPVVDQGKVFIRGYCSDETKVITVDSPIIVFGDHTRETKLVDFDFVVGADGVKLLRPIVVDPHFYYLAISGLKLDSRGYGRHFKLLRASIIPVPPLAEQKRIVAKVGELMALCDRLEAQQQAREAQSAQLARAALARFSNSTTAEELNFLFHTSYSISPSDFRDAILSAAVQGGLNSRTVSSSSIWETRNFDELCTLVTDGEHSTPARIDKGVPLTTAKNVRNGYLDLDNTDFVSQETAEKCWRRCKPTSGDILMVCVGATTGRLCAVSDPPDMVLVRSVALMRPDVTKVSKDYMAMYLRSPAGQSQIWGNVKQSAQPCLYLGKIKTIEMPLPTLSEQKRIVAKVAQLMTLVDQLETQLTTARGTAEKLMDAMVAELTNRR